MNKAKTLTEANKNLANYGIKIKFCKDWDEYQVTIKADKNGTYYTNELKDAIDTAYCIAKTQ